jgi:hypothetical protein
MARAAATQNYRTFVGGLVTEATGLSYPENTCRDLDNVDIDISGRIQRRLGIDNETNFTYQQGSTSGSLGTDIAVSSWLWRNPGNNQALNFLVVQSGDVLSIFNMAAEPVSGELIDAINISTLESVSTIVPPKSSGTSSEIYQERLQAVSGRGYLFCTSPRINPFYLSYDEATNAVTGNLLSAYPEKAEQFLAVRDFVGIPDGRDINEQVATTSINTVPEEYIYNAVNQGWQWKGDVQNFVNERRYIPSLSQARNGSQGAFDLAPTYAPRGSIIIDFMSGDRNLPVYKSSQLDTWTLSSTFNAPVGGSFRTCEFAAGRLWLAGAESSLYPNAVLFSKLIEKPEDAAFFAQVANPTETSDTDPLGSDLVDTDGGVIQINDAGAILRLISYSDGVLVFADNGVWFIRGNDGGFKATEYSVDRISDDGCLSAFSVVRSDEAVYYIAGTGINRISTPEGAQSLGALTVSSLSDGRIKTFYHGLNMVALKNFYGTYDHIGRRVVWLYRDADTYNPMDYFSVYNRSLIWDIRIGAFYKHSFDEVVSSGRVHCVGSVFDLLPGTIRITEEDVFASADNVLASTDQVVVNATAAGTLTPDQRTSLRFVMVDIDTSSGFQTFTIGKFINTTFKDFTAFFGVGQDYSSYLEIGDQIAEDLQRYKKTTYVHSFFDRTETAISSINPTVYNFPSSCQVRMKWDWHTSINGGRWNDSQQAYKFRIPVASPSVGAFDNGESIVYTRLKMRGKGKAYRLRYESETGKDFRLLGFSVLVTANAI